MSNKTDGFKPELDYCYGSQVVQKAENEQLEVGVFAYNGGEPEIRLKRIVHYPESNKTYRKPLANIKLADLDLIRQGIENAMNGLESLRPKDQPVAQPQPLTMPNALSLPNVIKDK